MQLDSSHLPVRGKRINQLPFPLVLQPSKQLQFSEILVWANENKQWIRQQLLLHGALLLRDCSVNTAADFERFIDAAGFPRMPYIGGAAPRSKVTQGRVLTSNESPPSEPIPFHQTC